MRIAYFDCFSGISGNMILGCLIDAGLDFSLFKKELKKLNLKGYEFVLKKVCKKEITGTFFEVNFKSDKKERNLRDILKVLDKSHFDKEIKNISKTIFTKIAKAESKIHNKKFNEVHFPQLGSLDTIIDVVGALVAIKIMNIKYIYSSPLNLGSGLIKFKNNILPVPAPATLELLKNIPVYNSTQKDELTTPTGAAIISTLANKFGPMPLMRIQNIGYGAGSKNLSIPNFLRVFIGELQEDFDEDSPLVIETNIDDMNPEIYGYLFEKLYKNGAVEVFLTPIIMKKNRVGCKLEVIVEEKNINSIIEVIFSETSTFGVRMHYVKRKKLKRIEKKIITKFGRITCKIGKIHNEVKNVSPEYEECKKIAEKFNIPLKEVYEEVKKSWK